MFSVTLANDPDSNLIQPNNNRYETQIHEFLDVACNICRFVFLTRKFYPCGQFDLGHRRR